MHNGWESHWSVGGFAPERYKDAQVMLLGGGERSKDEVKEIAKALLPAPAAARRRRTGWRGGDDG